MDMFDRNTGRRFIVISSVLVAMSLAVCAIVVIDALFDFGLGFTKNDIPTVFFVVAVAMIIRIAGGWGIRLISGPD